MESIKAKILSGSAWAFSGKLLAALLGVLVNVLLARLLVPEDFGTYFLVFSLVSVAIVIAQLGMNQAVIRLIAESMGTGKPERAVKAIKQVLVAVSLGAIIVAGIMAAGAGNFIASNIFQSHGMLAVTGLAALWVIVASLQGILAEIFRGFHNILLATLFSGLLANLLLVGIFGALWLWRYDTGLDQVIKLAVLAIGCSAILAGMLLRRKLKTLSPRPACASVEIWGIAWPLLVTNLTLFVLAQVDLWVLGVFRSQDEVAVYGAAARLTALITIPLMIVNAVTPPVIAEMYAQGDQLRLEKILRGMATVAGVPALLFFLVFAIKGEPLMEYMYGEFYRPGGVILALLGIGQLVNVCFGSCGLTLMMTGNQATMMTISVFSGFAAIAGAVLLVGPYGILGVAAAASAAMVMQNVSMLYMARKKCGIWTHAYCNPISIVKRAG